MKKVLFSTIAAKNVRLLLLVWQMISDSALIALGSRTDALLGQHNLFITAIFHALKGAVEALDQLLSAREVELPDFTDYVDQLVAEKGWSTQVQDSILVGSEGHESLFGVINGISYAVQQLGDDDAQADMELFAGQVLLSRAR